jgi:hypothetical protein
VSEQGRAPETLVSSTPKKAGEISIVYRPKTEAEAKRRVEAAQSLVGTPFLELAGPKVPKSTEMFTTTAGTPISLEAVEMVFNDALLMDAISNWGENGPLYETTCEGDELEVLNFARSAYTQAGIKIPPQLTPPGDR